MANEKSMKSNFFVCATACCVVLGAASLAAPKTETETKTVTRTSADGLVSLHPVYPPGYEEHQKWVYQSLERMRTVKVGMTRYDLNKVFKREGGFYTSSSQTFLYRDCPYFKVHVTFKVIGLGLEPNGNPKDEILSISEPVVNTVSQPN